MRRLLVVVVVLALSFVVLDQVLRRVAEDRAADRIGTLIHAGRPPEVTFHGLLFLPQVFSGRFEEVSVEAGSVSFDGIKMSHAVLELEGIEARLTEVIEGQAAIDIQRGHGTVSMSEAELNGVLGARSVPISVELQSAGVVVRSTQIEDAEAPGEVTVANNSLVISSSDLGVSESVELPRFTRGIRFREVRPRSGRLDLTFVIVETTLRP